MLLLNDNTDVEYPANSNSDIITVGAMSQCGERKSPNSCDGENWGSNYGETFDIVAPGVKIATTDRQGTEGYNTSSGTAGNYFLSFNGTSAATPHVAGVAALVLSINPYLTQDQVRDIIESTAQKVGSYTYSAHTGRTNGTWNSEMGYGLVNAYEAIIAAAGGPISGPSLVCSSGETFSITPLASFDNIQWNVGPMLSITSGQGTTSCLISATGNGSSYVTVTVTANGHSTNLPQKTVWSGVPQVQVTGPSSGCFGNEYTFYADYSSYSNPTSLEWSISPENYCNTIYGYGWWANAHFNWPSEELYQVRCTTQNACGTGNMANTYIYIYDCGYEYSLSPNPASTEVTITVTRTENNLNNMAVENTIFDISIFDNYGVKYFQGKYSGDRFTIPVYNLKNGNYFVRIDNGKNVANKQLIIMR